MRTVVAVLALVACVHAGLWALLRTKETAPDFTGQLASVSYAPFADSSHPDTGQRPTAEQIRADLKAIAPYTRAIRTYSSTGGAELVPPIAAEFGLKVTVGAWIDKDKERNEREIRSALDLARHNSNVNAIVVGNETTLRAEMTVDDLIQLIQKVKRQSPVPVTTGEIWTVWIDHPELASAVDFIAAHILPYWEGFDYTHAVDHTIEFYDKLRQMHPGKRIVIAEFGWPSAGYNFHNADPGRMEQAAVIRDFVHRADAYGIDYNIVEAIDQPWKTFEGGVGPYWGLFDASRRGKILLDRGDHRPRLHQARRPRRPARRPVVIADPDHERGDGRAGFAVGGVRQRGRRLVCRHRRLLEGPLLRARRRFCARPRHRSSSSRWSPSRWRAWRRSRPSPSAAARGGLPTRHRWCRRKKKPTPRKCPSTSRPVAKRRRCWCRRSMPSPASTIPISNAWW